MKYVLTICILAGSKLVTANVLPASFIRGLASIIKPPAALIVIPKNVIIKASSYEVGNALLQEEKNLNRRHSEWDKEIDALQNALQAAEKERSEVVTQLCWVKAAQQRVRDQEEDTQPQSSYTGKDLEALQKRILTTKEIAGSFNEYGPDGSFWNSKRSGEAKAQYEIKLRKLCDDLEEQTREYKKTLKSKASKNG